MYAENTNLPWKKTIKRGEIKLVKKVYIMTEKMFYSNTLIMCHLPYNINV